MTALIGAVGSSPIQNVAASATLRQYDTTKMINAIDRLEKLASSFIDDDQISIKLDDGGRFKMQRALLCDTSIYFRRALREQFQETRTKTLRIPGCTSGAFKLFIYWMCNSELPDLATAEEKALEPETRELAHSCQLQLIQLILMPMLQNAAMKCLGEVLHHDTVGIDAMVMAFDSVPVKYPLRRAMVQQASRDFLLHETIYQPDDIDNFSLIPGFWPALLEAMNYFHEVPKATCRMPTHHEHVVVKVTLGGSEMLMVALNHWSRG